MPSWDADHRLLVDADHPLPSPVSAATHDAARRYRLGRLRVEMVRHDCPAILLYDPVNIAYALDVSNMPVWMLHNASHSALVFGNPPAVQRPAHQPLAGVWVWRAGARLRPRSQRCRFSGRVRADGAHWFDLVFWGQGRRGAASINENRQLVYAA